MIIPKRIILSRTDSIGDVMLTLPIAGKLKEKFPECEILFLGRSYTKDIIELSDNIDSFINWDDFTSLNINQQVEAFKKLKADVIVHIFPNKKIARLAKNAGLKHRIGTSHRIYHFMTCNSRIKFSRKRSELHEAQLNFKLLSPFGINVIPAIKDIHKYYGLNKKFKVSDEIQNLISKDHFNLILHPKSKGSAREWGLDNYSTLIKKLSPEKFKIFIAGTAEEGEMIDGFLKDHEANIVDLTGKFSLSEYIQFISVANGIVAASTGPLHIAAALGKLAIGIYAPMKPIHPGRWAPIGGNAHALVLDKECNDCRKSIDCICIKSISPEQVKNKLENAGIL